jgi:hypothetical protein
MDLIEVRSDGHEHLLASGLTACEMNEVLDWWRYAKPFGPDVKIVVRNQTGNAFCLSATGTDVEPALILSNRTPSEVFVG